MDQREKNNQISEAIENAKNIAIFPNKLAGVDGFCSGVGLYLLLKNKEKNVDLVYPGKVPDGCESLLPAEEIKSIPTTRELVISIDYTGSPAARAQYTTKDGILYIKLNPINQDFDLSRIKTEIQGEGYDVIFTIGAQILDDFGQTYRDLEKEFYKAKVINIDNTDRNLRFGNYNIVDTTASSLSVLLFDVTRYWRLKLTDTAAAAFLKGITNKKS